jgi:hypothetical protein
MLMTSSHPLQPAAGATVPRPPDAQRRTDGGHRGSFAASIDHRHLIASTRRRPVRRPARLASDASPLSLARQSPIQQRGSLLFFRSRAATSSPWPDPVGYAAGNSHRAAGTPDAFEISTPCFWPLTPETGNISGAHDFNPAKDGDLFGLFDFEPMDNGDVADVDPCQITTRSHRRALKSKRCCATCLHRQGRQIDFSCS